MRKILSTLIIAVVAISASAQADFSHQNGGTNFQPNVRAIRNTINPSDINYWVGEGSNQLIAAFYFCDESTPVGFAYGYRWNGTKSVHDLLDDLAAADSRFSYTETSGFINFIWYIDDDYGFVNQNDGYVMYTIDGNYCSGLSDALVNNGVFELQEWSYDCYDYSNSQMLFVEDPNGTPEPPVVIPDTTFCGIVGTEGCTAIKYDNPYILGWATGCTITRGYQDIADPTTLVTYGEESMGIGPSSESTMDAVSLGDGGTAVLTFGMPIQNGEGFDFAVFENSLNDTFLELAFVEVSSDGVHFVRFPATSNTQDTLQISNGGSVDATKIDNLAGKYRAGWGTPFDLEQLADSTNLDINNITHVRLVDVVGSINPQYGTRDQYGQIINDPYPTPFYSSGFDLTGVAILNGWTPGTGIDNHDVAQKIQAYPNPTTGVVRINAENSEISVYDIYGKFLFSEMSSNSINLANYPAGVYIIKVSQQLIKVVKQ